jgi:hypothetical protein
MTPRMFLELCRRRNVRIRYERFANAQTAAAVYNVNRRSTDDPVVTAMDFVRDEAATEKREKVRTAKKFVKEVIGGLPMTTARGKFLETRLKVINDLRASGYEEAEQIFDECWPNLKPKENE